MFSYADDSRVYGQVKNAQDVKFVQQDLERVYEWAKDNKMEFNTDKFELLRFGKNDDLKNDTCYVSPNGEEIREKDSLRDLGVIMSNNLRFDEHIGTIVNKATQMAGWILRSFKTRNAETMMLLYKQLVRNGLEYCCPLWSPNEEGQKKKIENVQRSFTRKIDGLSGTGRPNYWERLKILNIYSMERRRDRYIILYTVKALNGIVPNPGFLPRANERTGPHLIIPLMRSGGGIATEKMIDRSLLVQGPRLFNILPKELRTASEVMSMKSFKRELDFFLSTVQDQPTTNGLVRLASSNSLIDQIMYKNALS